MIALVVLDSVRDSVNKKTGEPVHYRTLSVIDQDPDGPTLKTMVGVGIPMPGEKDIKNLAGHVVKIAFDEMGENYLGASGRGVVESILGVQRIEPVKKA